MLTVRPWLRTLARQLGFVERGVLDRTRPQRPSICWHRPRIEVLEDRVAPAIYTVLNTNDSGADSLRQAILDANANPGADEIHFNIGGGGVQTIAPLSALPTITEAVIIDGTTQPGFGGTPIIEVRGDSAGNVNGFTIMAANSTIRGLVINRFGLGFGIAGAGIKIQSSGATVEGNYIGTDVAGMLALGNGIGVEVLGGGFNRIGTDGDGVNDAVEQNIISGNVGAGISLVVADDNIVAGNFIGVNAAGTGALGNGYVGIEVFMGARNRIGTDGNGVADAAEASVISANASTGISINGISACDNVVAGNFIGTDHTGTLDLGNAGDGVTIFNGASNNTIGGTTAGTGNLISGNVGAGIHVNGETTTGTVIRGNYIGTNATGTAAVGNGYVGILLGAPSVTVGGGIAGARNLISGNTNVGIYGGSLNGRIQGNYIGTNAVGDAMLANGGQGALQVGGDGLVIGVDGDGVNDAGEGNVIVGTSGDAISLGGYNVTSIVVAGNIVGLNATGTAYLGAGPVRVFYQFVNTTVRFGTNADGVSDTLERNLFASGLLLDAGIAHVVAGNYFNTDVTGLIDLGDGYVGISSNGVRFGTNADGVRDDVERNVVVGSGSGNVFVYGSTNTVAGNYIGVGSDGVTAIGAQGSGVYGGGVYIIGYFGGGTGNTIGGTTAAARNIISGHANGAGVTIRYDGASANVVQGNYIGTDVTGTLIRGNTVGVAIEHGASNNTIGGTAVGPGNLISGNTVAGVKFISGAAGTNVAGVILSGNPVTGNVVAGNLIGTNPSGTAALANAVGVLIDNNSANNTIGGLTATPGTGAGNVISGNSASGVSMTSTAGPGTLIQGNIIGLNAAGSTTLANSVDGIHITTATGGAGTLIGGTNPQARNVIAGNTVQIALSTSGSNAAVTIQGNYIGTDITGTLDRSPGTGIAVGSAPGTIIGGTAAGAGNLIAGSSSGISISNISHPVIDGLYNCVVQGNTIGLSATGTPLPNTTGILITNADNLIGGTVAGARNIISGNAAEGIRISGATATGNVVQGNYIGTDASGAVARGNSGYGVYLLNAASNTIGGSAAGARNVISGNTSGGIFFDNANFNTIQNNYIGTDSAGASAIGNLGGGGIRLTDTTRNALIIGNLISGNTQGVQIDSSSDFNVLQGNFIGTNAAGDAAIPNTGTGVLVMSGASSNTIGGTTAAARNVISGNNGSGVFLTGAFTTGNLVQGNYIGTDVSGMAAVGNAGYGVMVQSGAASNLIGGDDAADGTVDGSVGARNVIAANGTGAILLTIVAGSGNQVSGNYIGLNSAGTAAFANAGDGVLIGSDGNLIGGNSAGAGNVIAGFATAFAVEITSGDNNKLWGNLIGLLPTAGNPVAANVGGVYLHNGAANNLIGTDGNGSNDPAERNVIAGSTSGEISINDAGTTGNLIAGNYIGTDATGTLDRGNAVGVTIQLGATNNTIGGITAAARNVISGNAGDGIVISGNGTTGNVVESNYIGTNALGNGLLPGTVGWWKAEGNADDAAGTNDSVLVNGATFAGGEVGQAFSFDGVDDFVQVPDSDLWAFGSNDFSIELWADFDSVESSTLNYPQAVLIGNDEGPGNTNKWFFAFGGGVLSFHIHTPGEGDAFLAQAPFSPVVGQWYHLAMTRSGNTFTTYINGIAAASENSTRLVPNANAPLTIGQAESAVGELQQFFMDGLLDEVAVYNRSLSATEIQVIYDQASAGKANDLGNDGDGVRIEAGASNNIIGGTVPGAGNVISGNMGEGIAISGSGTSGNLIQGNYIGTDVTGTFDLGNAYGGVTIFSADNNTVGGTVPGAGNVISGNLAGIDITGVGNQVLGNYIGTDASGMFDLGNDQMGIWIHAGSTGTIIGGTTAGVGNVISGNDWYGVEISDNGTTGNQVLGNYIGTDVTGTMALGNTLDGVIVDSDASGNLIGGTTVGAGNVIAFNLGAGVRLEAPTVATTNVRRNAFYANAGLAIDVGPAGFTPNDFPDVDGFLNFPVFTLTRIINSNADLEVAGTVGAGRTVEVYLASADATGYGEGRLFLFDGVEGSGADLDPDAGEFRFVIPLGQLPSRLGVISGALLTGLAVGSTSEFSLNTTITNSTAPSPSITGNPATAEEGTPITLGSIVVDPDIGDTFHYAWSVTKVGQPFFVEGPIAESAFTFTPDDNAMYVVTLHVTDAAGTSGTTTATISVTNTAPRVTILDAPAGLLVGSTITLNSRVDDQGAADLPIANASYVWSVSRVNSDGTSSPVGGPTSGASLVFNPTDNGIYTITLTVTDDDGGVGEDRALIIVSAEAPTVDILGVPGAAVAEGSAIALSSAVTDPIAVDSLVYRWSVTKNSVAYEPPGLVTDENVFVFTPDDNGTYRVTLRVTNVLGVAAETTSPDIIVTNMDPTVEILGIPATPFAGTLLTLTADVADQGSADVHAFQWSVVNSAGQDVPGGTGSVFSFRPAAAGVYAVTLNVTDDDLGEGLVSEEIVVVERQVTITGAPATSPEGTAINLTGSVSSPLAGDVFAWTVTKNNDEFATGFGTSFSFTPDDNGDYRIELVVTAADGSFGRAGAFIGVTNLNPMGSIGGLPSGTSPEGSPINLTSTASDPGTADFLSRSWSVVKFDATHPRPSGGLLFDSGSGPNFTFTPDDNGEYDVTLTVTDDDGGVFSVTETILVGNIDPTARIVTGNNPLTAEFHLTAFAFDPGFNDILSFSWSWSGPVTPVGPTNQVDFRFDRSGPGDIIITLTVTDDDGGSGTDVALIISADDNPNVITITDGEVVIDGSTAATFDPQNISRVVVLGQDGNDVITAGSATIDVVLDGGEGSNSLIGGSGDDVLIGGSGSDTLIGGGGNDFFIGRHGDDRFEGGAGDDEFLLVPGSDITVVEGGTSGGIDTLNFSLAESAITFNLGFQGEQTVDGFGDTVTAFGSFEVLWGSTFGDQLTVSAGSNLTIFGGDGEDQTLVAGGTGITIFGGDDASADVVTVAAGSLISIFGGDGADQTMITGAVSLISIFGGDGADETTIAAGSTASLISIFGDAGQDEVLVQTGSLASQITIFGGADSDFVEIQGGSLISIFGGDGGDTALVAGGTGITIFGGDDAATDVVTLAGGSSITIFGGGGDDVTQVSGAATLISIYGGDGSDETMITASSTASLISIFGGSGQDETTIQAGSLASQITIFGGGDSDTTTVAGGSHISIFGGDGQDQTLVLAGTQISIFGGEDGVGDVALLASGSQISIFGGSGADDTQVTGTASLISIFGGGGNDDVTILAASSGSGISIFGGAGQDETTVQAGSTASLITIFGGADADTALVQAGNLISIYGGDSNDQTTVAGTASLVSIFGGGDNDTALVTGSGTNISIFGGEGADVATVAAGSTASGISIFGDEGADQTFVHAGTNIVIYGGDDMASDTATITAGSLISIFGGGGDDSATIDSAGSLVSLISIFGGDGGDDVAVVAGSLVQGIRIYGGGGDDVATISAGATASLISIFGGDDADMATVQAGAIANLIAIFGEGGADTTVVAAGTNIGVFGGDDADQTTVSGTASLITIFGDEGGDLVTLAGSGTGILIFGGDGADSAVVTAACTANGILIFGGSGNDDATVQAGALASNIAIFGGSDDNTYAVAGGTSISIFGGNDQDQVLLSGTASMISIFGGGGDDSTTIAGTVSLISIFGGDGQDQALVLGGTGISIFGGDENDTATLVGSATTANISIFGGEGNDAAIIAAGSLASNISIFGGAGSDETTLQSGSQASLIAIFGDAGPDSVVLANGAQGSGVTIFGGEGADITQVQAGVLTSQISIYGGLGSDNLTAAGGTTVLVSGEQGRDTILVAGGQDVTALGGADSDTIKLQSGSNVIAYGEDGSDTYEFTTGAAGTFILRETTFAASVEAELEQPTTGSDTLDFAAQAAVNVNLATAAGQTVASGITITMIGSFENVIGTPGNDVIRGNAAINELRGGGGDDSLVGADGNDRLEGGLGNDTVAGGLGDDTYVFAGSGLGTDLVVENLSGSGDRSGDTLDFSGLATAVVIDLSQTNQPAVGAGLGITFSDPLGTENVIGSAFGDQITGNTRNNILTGGPGNDTLVGGDGSDTYVFAGLGLGEDLVVEAGGIPASSDCDTLDFTTFGGPINLNLASTAPQTQAGGELLLTLSSATGIEDVLGTSFGDVILGNTQDNRLYGIGGPDQLDGQGGIDYVQGGRTQVVYLEFDNHTTADDHEYSPDERNAILARLQADFASFFFTFMLTQPTEGGFITITFNDTPILDGGSATFQGFIGGDCPQCQQLARLGAGGLATELDFRNLSDGGKAFIDVNQLLGGELQPFATSENYVAISATIAAHELGHLIGLRHADAFGPIGSGIFAGVDSAAYIPVYLGPSGAVETVNHIMGSPASIHTTLGDAANDVFLGEREAIKIAFADTGVVTSEQTGPHGDPGLAQDLGALPSLFVPNTLVTGQFSDQDFAVAALSVLGAIGLPGESDWYSFVGQAGDIYNLEVISSAISRTRDPIDSVLRVWRIDASGERTLVAENDDEFETRDSSIIDLVLPADGLHFLEVTAFSATDVGTYELFVYGFAQAPGSGRGDSVIGRGSSEVLVGSSGSDLFQLIGNFSSGMPTIIPGVGSDLIDTTQATGLTPPPEPPAPIKPTNAPPSLNTIGARSAAEGSLLSFQATAIDPDLPLDQLTFSLAAPLAGTMAAGASIDPLSGVFSWVPAQDGVYRVQVVVTDTSGATSFEEIEITVSDVAPLADAGPDQAATEGSPVTFFGTFFDPGTSDTHQLTWQITSPNLQLPLMGSGSSFIFTPAQEGTYTAIFTVTDTVTLASDSATALVIVSNVPPVVEAGPDSESNEGDTFTGAGFFTDPGADVWTASVDYGDGTGIHPLALTGSTFNLSHLYKNEGAYTVTVRINDGTTTTADTRTVTVLNQAPANVSAGADRTVNEGDTVDLNGTFTDAGVLDTHTVLWLALRSNGEVIADSVDASFSFTPDDNGTYTVLFKVTDNAGANTTASLSVTVNNVAPTPTITGVPVSPTEGTAIALGSMVTDPGSADTFTYAWTVTFNSTIIAEGHDSTFGFTPADDGNYVVTLTVTDDDGDSGTAMHTFAVGNVAPTVAITGAPTTGFEGTAINLSSSVSDPGTAETFTYAWSVTKNSNPYGTGAGAGFSFTPDDDGSYVVTLNVSDGDATTSAMATIEIDNVAPAVSILGAPGISPAGEPINLTAAVTDAGSADTFTYAWSVTKNGGSFATGSGASFSFTPDDEGNFEVTVTVTDDYGDSASASSFTVAIRVAPTAAIIGPLLGVRGQPLTFTVSATDSAADEAAGFVYTINWGDGSGVQTIARAAGNGAGVAVQHAFVAEGAYTVTVTATDLSNTTSAPAMLTIQIAIAQVQVDPYEAGKHMLVIGGTTADDTIQVRQSSDGQNLLVKINNQPELSFAYQASFQTLVDRLIIYAQAGNDTVIVAQDITIPAEIYGQLGNDRLKGGGGNDLLIGGDGNDLLIGNEGRDLLIGGIGEDKIVGNADDDILIAGRTSFDESSASLRAIMAEWTSGRSYSERVDNLAGVGTGTRLNGTIFFKVDGVDRTVFDDGQRDLLTGGTGLDWFLFNADGDGDPSTRDQATDLNAAEFQADIDFILS